MTQSDDGRLLAELCLDIARFQATNFPDDLDRVTRAGKICEEAGEVMGAAIKGRRGYRSDEDYFAELGDVLISAIGACMVAGRNPLTVAAERFYNVVQDRDYRNDPATWEAHR